MFQQFIQSTHVMAQVGAESQKFGQAKANDALGEQHRFLGKGRGRGRGKRREDGSDVLGDEFQQEVVGTYDTKIYEAVMRGDTEAVKATLFENKVGQDVPSYFTDYESMMSGTSNSAFEYAYVDSPVTVSAPPFKTAAPKKAATKTNGYCLFIKQMGMETSTVGSINELMAMFDKDWKNLPEEDKKMWKARAKSGWKPDFRKYGAGKGRGRGSRTTPSTTQKEEKDYDTDEERDQFY